MTVISAGVEPQILPVKTTATAAPTAPAPGTPALFMGLDVHNDSVAASPASADSTEVPRYGLVGGWHNHVLRPASTAAADVVQD